MPKNIKKTLKKTQVGLPRLEQLYISLHSQHLELLLLGHAELQVFTWKQQKNL